MKPHVVHVKASELLANGKVAVRLRQLQGIVAERAMLTAQTILDELEQARLLALQMKQPGAMVAASMGRAKVAGLIVDRKEVGAPNEFDHMTDEELRRFIIEGTQGLGVDLSVPKARAELSRATPWRSGGWRKSHLSSVSCSRSPSIHSSSAAAAASSASISATRRSRSASARAQR